MCSDIGHIRPRKFSRHLPQGGELFGASPASSRVSKLSKSPPHVERGIPQRFSPSCFDPLVGRSCMPSLCGQEKTQGNPYLLADRFSIGPESDQLCLGMSPPHSRKGPESLHKQTIRCFFILLNNSICSLRCKITLAPLPPASLLFLPTLESPRRG